MNFIDKRRDQNAFYRIVRRNFPQIVPQIVDNKKGKIITNFPEIECQSQMNFVKYHLYRYFRHDYPERYMWACYPSLDNQPRPDQTWIDEFARDVREKSKFSAFDIGRTFVLDQENSVFPCPDSGDQWECEISFKMVDDKIPYIPKFNEELEAFFNVFFKDKKALELVNPAKTALLQNFRKEVMSQDKGRNPFLSRPWLGTEYFIHDADTFTLELPMNIAGLSGLGLRTSDRGGSILDKFISFPPPEGIDAVNFFALHHKLMQTIVYFSFWEELMKSPSANKRVSWNKLAQFEFESYNFPKDLDFQNEKKSFLNKETRDFETSWSIFATAISPALEPYITIVDEFLWPEGLDDERAAGGVEPQPPGSDDEWDEDGDVKMGDATIPEVKVKRHYCLSPRQREDNKLLDMLRRDIFDERKNKAEMVVQKEIEKPIEVTGGTLFWNKYKSEPKFRDLGFQNENEFNDMTFNWIPARIKAFITRDEHGNYFSYSGAVQIEVKVWRKEAPWVCASQKEIFNLARYDDFGELKVVSKVSKK